MGVELGVILTGEEQGLGGSHKAEWINSIKRNKNIQFISAQETQLVDVENIPVARIWGGNDFEMVAVESSGRSGGLLCCWDHTILRIDKVHKSPNLIALSGTWKGIEDRVNIVNVYAPQDDSEKKELWDEILTLKDQADGIWVIMGDFNEIRDKTERSTNNGSKTSMDEFNKFIVAFDLHEFQMGGSKYTWMKDDGSISSKLDRFLVCKEFISRWPTASVTTLNRLWSDHNPVTLICNNLDYGPSPFRFYNSWLKDDELEKVVSNAWKKEMVTGTPDFVLAKKLKSLKEVLRTWCKNKKEEERKEQTQLQLQVQEMDEKADLAPLTDTEKFIRSKARKELYRLEWGLGHPLASGNKVGLAWSLSCTYSQKYMQVKGKKMQ
ncbi:hypothetical protein QVD17_01087 [Tagetes erecta]|uniref:Endonuclease/exonuclease/phosphatase domain-containing protein n=1 Tax=Tagetes erecta TaxID=13708 RepID=A0AAD8L9Z9_TARER|nr:hypothetical protein QVD17_01087 [Tagetes erecta]